MIRITTVEREFGSRGGVIAANLATRPGWTLCDRRLTVEIAGRMDGVGLEVWEREDVVMETTLDASGVAGAGSVRVGSETARIAEPRT